MITLPCRSVMKTADATIVDRFLLKEREIGEAKIDSTDCKF
jgi:hypothetical protein